MLNILLLDTLQEKPSVSNILKTAYERRELPVKRIAAFSELAELLAQPIAQFGKCNVFIASFSKPEKDYIEFAMALRRQNENIFTVFVVDKLVDVAACVRPSVRPSGIMFVPLDKDRIYQTVKEIYIEYLRLAERGELPVFKIKSGGEYYNISTGDILFFEAQAKKIAIKTMSQEISFYYNFETVLDQLPDWFIRCHKGFVVNTRKIISASFVNMLLEMKDGSKIPVSRSYRDSVRSVIEAKEE
jgi:DNA-binding LytR/AlgR family response regulator